MILRLASCLLLLIAAVPASGQVPKCDGDVLLVTHEHMGKLTQSEIRAFLLTLGKECKDNAEFSEWSNELMFSVLEKHTELTLRTIDVNEKHLDMDAIYSILKSPIHDLIDVRGILAKVQTAKIKSALKNRIVENLRFAAQNLGN
ncbi:MAG TPA: hypothetical protein PLX35_14810 [Cyclobacteriaceae bacterium]|nr:hypothetical protein [Cyclobacteriaceae bacterium]